MQENLNVKKLFLIIIVRYGDNDNDRGRCPAEDDEQEKIYVFNTDPDADPRKILFIFLTQNSFAKIFIQRTIENIVFIYLLNVMVGIYSWRKRSKVFIHSPKIFTFSISDDTLPSKIFILHVSDYAVSKC